jgi:hypothetical protein
MRVTGWAVICLLLCGCQKPESSYERAQRHYEYLRSHGGSQEEICAAVREVKAAAVDAAVDELTYVRWSQADLRCELEGLKDH